MNKINNCQYDLNYDVQKSENPVQEKEEMELFRKISFISNFFRSCKDKCIRRNKYEIFNGQLFRIR